MIINGIFILLSFIINIIFNYIYLKNAISKKNILLLMIMNLSFCIVSSKIMTLLSNNDSNLNLLNSGLSSYGGAIGIILSSLIYSKFIDNKMVIKSNILVLPLMYSISKLGCFFAGCCYGIPYNGIFNVVYVNKLNIQQFPIQLLESVIFFIIFLICIFNHKKENIAYILVFICALAKFILDYFRYSHLHQIISINQIVSIIIIIIDLIYYIMNLKRQKN